MNRLAALLAVLAVPACSVGVQSASTPETPAPTVSDVVPWARAGVVKSVTDPDLRAALMSIPEDVTTFTFTDFEAVKERLGYGDLTSDSVTTERIAFREAIRSRAALLTDGRLYPVSSTMSIDYGWTQEDVEWEVDFTGPDGGGFVLGLREGQAMEEVLLSFEDNGFESVGRLWQAPEHTGAEQVPFETVLVNMDEQLIVSGDMDTVSAVQAGRTMLFSPQSEILQTAVKSMEGSESMLVRTGEDACVRLDEAMGPDIDAEVYEDYLAGHDIGTLQQPVVSGISFTGTRDAEAMVGFVNDYGVEADRAARVAWTQGWRSLQGGEALSDIAEVVDAPQLASILGIELAVKRPRALVAMALTDEMPWALCNEVRPLEEPTGL